MGNVGGTKPMNDRQSPLDVICVGICPSCVRTYESRAILGRSEMDFQGTTLDMLFWLKDPTEEEREGIAYRLTNMGNEFFISSNA